MNQLAFHFVMLGPPASGKGTQGRRLARQIDADYLSTGAELRREVASGSALGQEAQRYLKGHNYVPDSLAIDLVHGWLAKRELPWVLDGFPRSLPQAEFLCAGEFSSKGVRAIFLDVSEQELRQRVAERVECLKCGKPAARTERICSECGALLRSRSDDSVEGFESRFRWYQRETTPVLDYFAARDMLIQIDGDGPAEEVWSRLKNQVC